MIVSPRAANFYFALIVVNTRLQRRPGRQLPLHGYAIPRDRKRGCRPADKDFAPSLTVLTTIVNNRFPGRLTADAGSKALTLNKPNAGVIGEPGMDYNAGSDEFGAIRFETATRLKDLPNVRDVAHGIQGNRERVQERVRVTDAATRHDIQRRNRRTRRTKPVFSAGSASSALIVVAGPDARTGHHTRRTGLASLASGPLFSPPRENGGG